MSMEKVRFALIGCGRVAKNHAEALTHIPEAELRVVCDIVPEKAQQFAQRYQSTPETDYQRVIERDDVDAVCIATPSGDHPRIGIDAALAGKHVIVEKPIGLTLAEIDLLISTCKQQNVKLCVVHQNRFNPAIALVKQAMDAGNFGKISHAAIAVRWNRGSDYYSEASWRGTWEQDGGALMNQSIHAVDILRWMMHEPASLQSFTATQFHDIQAEDVAVASLRFRSGALGLIEASTNVFPSNWEETLSIFGETGCVAVGGVALNRIERWEFGSIDEKTRQEIAAASMPDPPSVYGKGHGRLLAEVVRSIKDGKPMPVTGEEGRAAVEIVLGVYRSNETMSQISFPLLNESGQIAAAREVHVQSLKDRLKTN